MTENTPSLVLEQLRHIRATTDRTGAKLLDLERHLIELPLQVAGLAREDAHIQAKLAEHEIRFERIEKRLELRDE
jgi:hypothetical protein